MEQPQNRGTAAGVLLPLLVIHGKDPRAEILIMPSDHFVERDDVLCSALEEAWVEAQGPGNRIVLVGITPGKADPDYGWVLPSGHLQVHGLKRVAAFLEKPTPRLAMELMARGALINSFLIAARSRALLRLYRQQPSLLKAFGTLLREGVPAWNERGSLARLYEAVPIFDFSRDLLEASPDLWVLPAPPCGWSDLGTPERVTACLGSLRPRLMPRRRLPRPVLDRGPGAEIAALSGLAPAPWVPHVAERSP